MSARSSVFPPETDTPTSRHPVQRGPISSYPHTVNQLLLRNNSTSAQTYRVLAEAVHLTLQIGGDRQRVEGVRGEGGPLIGEDPECSDSRARLGRYERGELRVPNADAGVQAQGDWV